jgi:hypothetical protein
MEPFLGVFLPGGVGRKARQLNHLRVCRMSMCLTEMSALESGSTRMIDASAMIT